MNIVYRLKVVLASRKLFYNWFSALSLQYIYLLIATLRGGELFVRFRCNNNNNYMLNFIVISKLLMLIIMVGLNYYVIMS
jgi:hypothetical protein